MSANVLSDKKIRKLESMTGLTIERAIVWSNHESGRIANARTPGDIHYWIDRRTGEYGTDGDGFNTMHFSSCGRT